MAKSPFKEFQQHPPRPPSVAIDRMGNVIEPGHLLLVHEPNGFAFEVVDVRPVLNPGVQAPVVQLTLQAKFNVHVLAAQRNNGVVVIGLTEARMQAQQNGQPAPGPSLVLTDPDGDVGNKPAQYTKPDSPVANVGRCNKCGDGPDEIGLVCTSCGVGTYERI